VTLRGIPAALGLGGALVLPLVAAGDVKDDGGRGDAGRGRKQFFTTAACSGCHMVNGRGGKLGPELSHVGKIRDADWLAAKVFNPRLGKPDTIMPSAADLGLNERTVADLAAYLDSLE
jgi:mono/diheme cytochrome c family protein